MVNDPSGPDQPQPRGRHAHNEDAVLAEIGRIITSSPEIGEVFEAFAAQVRRLVPFDRLAVVSADPEQGLARTLHAAGVRISDEQQHRPLPGSALEQAMRTRGTLILQGDGGTDEPARRAPAVAAGVRAGLVSTMIVPLVAHDRFVGGLVFRSKVPNAYTQADVRAGERVAQQVAGVVFNWEALVRQRETAQELRRTQDRLRLATESAGIGFWEWDIAAQRIAWSQNLDALFGLSPGTLDGQADTFLAALHPDDRETVRQAFADAVAQRSEMRFEYRVRWPDGSVHWLEARAVVLTGPNGEPTQVAGTTVDVSARRRREELQHMLADAADLLASSLDYQATLQNIAQLAIHGLTDWCAVDVLQLDGTIRRLAVAHRDPAKVELANEMLRRWPVEPTSEFHAFLAAGEPMFLPEVTEEMVRQAARDEEQFQLLRSLGLRSAILVPLVARGRGLGRMTLVTAESGYRFTEEDVRVASELGRRCAQALDNARLLQEAQNSERRLSGVVGSAMDAIITIGEDRRIVLFNRAAEEMFGVPADAAQDDLIDRFLPERFRQAHVEHIRRFVETGETTRAMGALQTLYGLRADGREFPIEATISQVEVDGHKLLTVMLRDISERERTAETIRQLSTPILQIQERLLLLPLIGAIDTARAEIMTSTLLSAVRLHRAKAVVIDVTGVALMDAAAGDRLIKAADAAGLLGAAIFVSGVSREVAALFVQLGLDLRRVRATGDLQQGIQDARAYLDRPRIGSTTAPAQGIAEAMDSPHANTAV